LGPRSPTGSFMNWLWLTERFFLATMKRLEEPNPAINELNLD